MKNFYWKSGILVGVVGFFGYMYLMWLEAVSSNAYTDCFIDPPCFKLDYWEMLIYSPAYSVSLLMGFIFAGVVVGWVFGKIKNRNAVAM